VKTTELNRLLHDATSDLTPPPGFTDTVLRGGRRRRQRRRLAVATSIAVVLAVAASTTLVAASGTERTAIGDSRLAAPTKGNLAGDQAFLDQVLAAWKAGLRWSEEADLGVYDDRRGDPHVYWAGDTPAGRAAVVMQRVHPHAGTEVAVDGAGLLIAQGLVATDVADGKLKLVSTRNPFADTPGLADFYQFGRDNRTLLIVDGGKPLHYSFTVRMENERYFYDWQRARPKDGVAIVNLPGRTAADPPPDYDAGTKYAYVYAGDSPPQGHGLLIDDDFYDSPVYRRPPASDYLRTRLIDPDDEPGGEEHRQVWDIGDPIGWTSHQIVLAWGARGCRAGIRPDISHGSTWMISAGLPDGRAVILRDMRNFEQDTTPPQLCAMVGSNRSFDSVTMVDGGTFDPGATLPVALRIPHGGGWIVSRPEAELSFRTAPDGAWQDAGGSAALLPDNAVEVKVGDEVVPLPR
jgi:hypothetical protein